MSIYLRGNVLVRNLLSPSILAHLSMSSFAYQVHPIPGTCDQTCVGQRIHRRQFLKRYRLMHEVNRHEFDGAESTVNPPDELVDTRAEILILLHILSGRNGELHQDYLFVGYGK